MAHVECHFYSETLQLATALTVLLPEDGGPGERFPALWLLHGYTEDHTAWCRRTSLERYAAGRRLAVVMPQGENSYYTNMKKGRPYWDFFTGELLLKARSFFPLSEKGEENYVAGLSMGGYGAFKLALRRPDLFSAAGSFSGALDILSPVMKRRNDSFGLIFGDFPEPEDDLMALAQIRSEEDAPLPRLFQFCGTEDFLYKDNIRFRDYLISLGIPSTYREDKGIHDWGLWDRHLPDFLDWLEHPGKE